MTMTKCWTEHGIQLKEDRPNYELFTNFRPEKYLKLTEKGKYMENMMSVETKDLMGALAKAQGSMAGAVKDSSNPFFKSKYADLASVWDACRQPLALNGLSISQMTNFVGEEICLVTILGHSSGQWIKSVTPLPLEKRDPQTLGKCITYCRRYALAAMVGVYQEDDDAESITDHSKKPVAAQPSKTEPMVAAEAVLTKEQVATIKGRIQGHSDVISEVLKKTGKKLIQDIEYRRYNDVINLIDQLMAREGAA